MIVLLIMMTTISATLRLIPFIFAKWLGRWGALAKISATLPMCISILIVAYLVEPTTRYYPFAIPELAGLTAVVGIQIWLRNLLLSMAAGVCIHQIALNCL